ncbi:MAG TPA: response regulator [Gemmatimonadales bacterium]|nr:response regulator [Gemmatimonadales bacterium]
MSLLFPAATAPVERAPASAGTILLVEDEAPLRRATARILEQAGYAVVVAEDGERALEILRARAHEITLVVSDVVMPKMGGLQLREALVGEGIATRLLLTSGYAAGDIVRRANLPPDVTILQKPYTIEELWSRVREMLKGPPA